MVPVFRKKWTIMFGLCALALPLVAGVPAHAEGDGDDDDSDAHRASSMHNLAGKLPLPRARKDFSKYHFTPPGDRVVEQPDTNRLLFWTKDGQPDGYAQRRGSSVIYYNAQGQAIRVQRLTPEEMAD
ncbi:hypothetical protein [Acetobacter syzygii]|uniref:Uncharacterized protein n=1 Tax=Acetobacter syzygii TaxID=146476 RepID=A0A270BQD8_9PROT|nr:hypothetical protein [Acetobacter syzygii]NSL93505.1 hypothetical protein [Acetobacter syzygii]PAL27230.1 hypothetical protein B9K05_04470 [Acetobacter syzygii]PAL27768.1 hypothetical protein B9K04_03050 [Acetobacter syzygii]GAN71604.1 hypothetical protein Absy_021_043 [Acetobacter syzygii]GBR62458.1 hypothetical protein AA0483_0383 [Acetobacter syzygii NRIC 0483]